MEDDDLSTMRSKGLKTVNVFDRAPNRKEVIWTSRYCLHFPHEVPSNEQRARHLCDTLHDHFAQPGNQPLNVDNDESHETVTEQLEENLRRGPDPPHTTSLRWLQIVGKDDVDSGKCDDVGVWWTQENHREMVERMVKGGVGETIFHFFVDWDEEVLREREELREVMEDEEVERQDERRERLSYYHH